MTWKPQLIELAKAWDFKIKLKGPSKYGEGLSRDQVIGAHEALVTALQQFAVLADSVYLMSLVHCVFLVWV